MSRYFWPIFIPLPPVTLCHTSRDTPKSTSDISGPPLRFLVGLVQKPGQKPLVQILSQLFAGFLSGGFCQGVFCLEGFVRGGFCPFPFLSECICYNRKLNITFSCFICKIKKIISVTSHALEPQSPPVTNCHTFLDPLTPLSVTYFMDGP